MSLHSIDKKLKSLSREYNTLLETREGIKKVFDRYYESHDEESWKTAEFRGTIQQTLIKVKSDIKINQAKSKHYKVLYKKIQQEKVGKVEDIVVDDTYDMCCIGQIRYHDWEYIPHICRGKHTGFTYDCVEEYMFDEKSVLKEGYRKGYYYNVMAARENKDLKVLFGEDGIDVRITKSKVKDSPSKLWHLMVSANKVDEVKANIRRFLALEDIKDNNVSTNGSRYSNFKDMFKSVNL